MAINRKKPEIEEQEPEGEPGEGMTPAEMKELMPDIVKINEILKSQDISGGKIRMERKGPTDTGYQYVATMPAEQFDIEWVRKVYGGGDYKCKTFRANGQHFKPFDFSIDYRIKGSMDNAGIPGQGNATIQQVAGLIQQLKGNEGGSNAMMLELLKAQAGKSSESTTLLVTMMMESNKLLMTTMSGALQAIASAGKREDSTAAWLPLMIEMVKSRSAGGGEGKSDILTIIEAVKALKQLSTDDREEDMFDKIAKVAAPVMGMISGRGMAAVATDAPPVQSGAVPIARTALPLADNGGPTMPGRITTTSAAQPPPAPAAGVSPLAAQIRTYADILIMSAARDADVMPFVGMLFDALDTDTPNPDESNKLDECVAMLREEGWMQKLAADDARILQYQAWFCKLRDAIVEEYDKAMKEANDEQFRPEGQEKI